jgi:DNA-binding MarR family transcriptional regulator
MARTTRTSRKAPEDAGASEASPTARFPQCTAMAMSQATRRVQRLYDAALAPHGISVGQFGLLSQIAFMPGLSLHDLAQRNVMDPSTVSRLIRPMIDRGWVRLEADARDRRVKRLRLTEEGMALQKAAMESRHRAEAELQAVIGADTAADIRATMRRLVAQL